MRLLPCLLLSACLGDNIVATDAAPELEPLWPCCRNWPNGDAIRVCVAQKTPGEVCRRLDCVVWDEWICPGGASADETRDVDGVTQCMCDGRWP